GDVNAEPAFLQRIEILSVALPLPLDAALHHLERNRLNIDQIPHENVPEFRSDRRHPNSTVAHDYSGDTVPGRAGDQWIPGHLSVVMRMWVNKSGREHEPVGVDSLGRSLTAMLTDRGNQAVFYRDATVKAGRPRPVTNTGVFDE